MNLFVWSMKYYSNSHVEISTWLIKDTVLPHRLCGSLLLAEICLRFVRKLKSSYGEYHLIGNWDLLTTASTNSLSMWVILLWGNLPASVKPSNDCNTSQPLTATATPYDSLAKIVQRRCPLIFFYAQKLREIINDSCFKPFNLHITYITMDH